MRPIRRYVRAVLAVRSFGITMLVALTAGITACAGATRTDPAPAGTSSRMSVAAEGPDARAVRAARAAQNRAIAALDTATIASFWTDDVEIRRGLGVLVTGREAYKRLFNPDAAAVARGEELVYQREPASVIVSERWPLAYEEGTWAGHRGGKDGPAVIGGRYAAQWVRRGERWLIRGEVYVALTCSAAGCASAAAP